MEIEEQPINDEAELLLDKIEEEMAAEDSEEDEDNLLHIDDLQNITNINKVIITNLCTWSCGPGQGVGILPLLSFTNKYGMEYYFNQPKRFFILLNKCIFTYYFCLFHKKQADRYIELQVKILFYLC